MHELPHHLYRADQVRELDRIAIEEHEIPGLTLMERAGAAAFSVLQLSFPTVRRIAVICGGGNNGGDGYVLARIAHAAGLSVSVFYLEEPEHLCGAAAQAFAALHAEGVISAAWSGQSLGDYEVIVDAIFGTGLDREVTGPFRKAIEAINASAAGVLAVDISSGLHADTGRILGAAVMADVTVTFIGLKQGQFTASGRDYSGTIHYNDLDIPRELFARVRPAATRFSLESLAALLAPRRRNAHKGHFGHVLVIGGEQGMMGAMVLAADAALRTGAGLVSAATRAVHAPLASVARPELMAHVVEDIASLRPLLERATVIAIGPGLGQSSWARHLFGMVVETRLPMVVDADALNILGADPLRRDNWVITPHPGEAGRLLGCTAREIEQDRFQAVGDLQERYGGVAVLKGAGTLIGSADRVIDLCDAGNPGMASGGMGDVLTGVIAALLAQGLSPTDAACLGTALHAAAGDCAAAAGGERGLIASDLVSRLHSLVNPLPGY